MAELHLTVDNVDNVSLYQAEYEKAEAEKARTRCGNASSTRSGEKKPPPPPPPPEPRRRRQYAKGGTDYSDVKVASILRDYLQPTTTLSQQDALTAIIELIPDDASEMWEVYNFSEICVELAWQIPYDHPSQFKLAHLVRKLGATAKFQSFTPTGSAACQLLWGHIRDASSHPVEDAPYGTINIAAFEANLVALGLSCGRPDDVAPSASMRYIFEKPPDNLEDWEKNILVMEMAQWILCYGQMLYRHVVYAEETSRWEVWKNGFKEAQDASYTSDECKRLSRRAVRLMVVFAEE